MNRIIFVVLLIPSTVFRSLSVSSIILVVFGISSKGIDELTETKKEGLVKDLIIKIEAIRKAMESKLIISVFIL